MLSGSLEGGAAVGLEAAHRSAVSAGGAAPCAVSVLILTKDEESNIAGCLEGLRWCDDVVVLDSHSKDRTVEIARRFPNVRVVQRVFDTEYMQRNYGLHEIGYAHDWVYICDADERVPADLREEIGRVARSAPATHAGYRLRYKNMFMGKWIKRSTGYPVWLIRLVRPRRVRYEVRETNVHPIIDGQVGELQSHFLHYSFNIGLKRWFEKHNYYSGREALEAVKVRKGGRPRLGLLRDADPLVRRRALKNLSFFLPMRGAMRFLHNFVIRGGWIEGWAGFHYCALVSMYEYWIDLKVVEQERRWRERTDETERAMLREEPPEQERWAGGEASRPKIDVMIPTFNEAVHISETVANARALGPVYVLDSFSTDGTQDLARKAGATVIEHPFENYSRQKNWGLENLPMTGDWVFILDGDERITPALRDECLRMGSAPGNAAGFYVNRVVIFMGRQIWHGGLYPSWNLRFFRRGACRYEDRSVHEHMVCSGETRHMRRLMLHLRRESINDYLTKHIKYADMESNEWVKMKTGDDRSAHASQLFGDVKKYRIWLRRVAWPVTPFKPLIRFLFMYFLRLGVLDGRAGWHLAWLMASYEYMIGLLYREKLAMLGIHPGWGHKRVTGAADEPSAAVTAR